MWGCGKNCLLRFQGSSTTLHWLRGAEGTLHFQDEWPLDQLVLKHFPLKGSLGQRGSSSLQRPWV